MKQNVFFVSGIDTDAGKSYATGFLAREWNKNGQRTCLLYTSDAADE